MGGTPTDLKLIDENGLRIDGRRPDQMRPLKIEAGVLKRADGSAYVEWGYNKVLAAVYGPRECHPRHLQNPTRALVQCKYNMAAFSVDDRKRPGPDRRSQEISKITSEALSHVVFTEYFPRTSIDVYIEVLQANAGTRCAGLTAASVALADAGIPMKDLVASCAAGKAADTIVLDPGKEEDNFGQADIPLGYVPRTEEIVLLQMDGDLTHDEFKKGLNMAVGACKQVYEIQRDALKRRYMARSVDEAIAAPSAADVLKEGV
jgi:exosome complex component RRP41